jgi:hypothetical protein
VYDYHYRQMMLGMNNVCINRNKAKLTGELAKGDCMITSFRTRGVFEDEGGWGGFPGLPEWQNSRDSKMDNKINKLNAKGLFTARRIFKLLS